MPGKELCYELLMPGKEVLPTFGCISVPAVRSAHKFQVLNRRQKWLGQGEPEVGREKEELEAASRVGTGQP